MKFRCLSMALGLASLLFTSTWAFAQENGELSFEAVRQVIEEQITQKQAPSVAIAVVKDDKLLIAEGFGLADVE